VDNVIHRGSGVWSSIASVSRMRRWSAVKPVKLSIFVDMEANLTFKSIDLVVF
jgi:hypothetical protein